MSKLQKMMNKCIEAALKSSEKDVLHRHGAVLIADGITFIGHNQSRTSCGAISRGCIHSLHAEAAAIQRCILQSKGTPKVP